MVHAKHPNTSEAIRNLISMKHIPVSETYGHAGISSSHYYTFIHDQGDISFTKFNRLLDSLNVSFDELPLYIDSVSSSSTLENLTEEAILTYKKTNSLSKFLKLPKRDFCNAIFNKEQSEQIRTAINTAFQHSEYYTTTELKVFLMFINYFSDNEIQHFIPRVLASVKYISKRTKSSFCVCSPDAMQVNTLLIYQLILSSIRNKDAKTCHTLLTFFPVLSLNADDWMSALVQKLVEIVQLILLNRLEQARQKYDLVLVAVYTLQPRKNRYLFDFLLPETFDLFCDHVNH